MIMRLLHQVTLYAVAFVGCTVLGCAAGGSDLSGSSVPSEGSGAQQDLVYSPQIQPDTQFETVKRDLAKMLNKKERSVEVCESADKAKNLIQWVNSTAVYDDRLEIRAENADGTLGLTLSFYQLLGSPIAVVKHKDSRGRFYRIDLPFAMTFDFLAAKNDLPGAKRLADHLFFLQQRLQKQQDALFAQVEAKAAEYRALKVKPPLAEEQRKLVVQANAANQQKQYGQAIGLYLQALERDPVSYPAAYFNLALLHAQLRSFTSAIGYMKQYLLLAPDAPDARSAQDKIYEWELLLKE